MGTTVVSLNGKNGLSVGSAPINIFDSSGNQTSPAGTTANAFHKLTAGVQLTTATAGSWEYDGNLLYFTIAGPSRKTLAFTDSNITGTATNATNVGVTNDTSTASARYITWVDVNSGNNPIKVTSTKLSFIPSTGILSATGFAGDAAGLTGIPAANITGTIPGGVLGASTLYIGTTAIALNRASASQSLTGINIDGTALNITGILAVAQGGSGATATTGTAGNNVLSNTPTITTPIIDVISASSASLNAATLWSTITTGTIKIGDGVTTGTILIGNTGSGAKAIGIGTSTGTTTVTGNFSLPTIASASGVLFTTITTGVVSLASGPQIASALGATAVSNATLATSATNIAGGGANGIPYQTGSGSTTFLVQGTGVLQESAGAPSWTTAPTIAGTNFSSIPAGQLTGTIPSAVLGNSTLYIGTTAILLNQGSGTITTLSGVSVSGSSGTATTATNLAGNGNDYSIPYQHTAALTVYLNNGTTGQIMIATTSGAPSWSATPTITTSVTVPLLQGTSGAGGAVTIRGGTNNAGTVNLDAATIDSSNATVALFGTPTTLTLFSSGTAISIGSVTGTTTINNNLVVQGNLTVNGLSFKSNDQTLAIEDKNIELGSVASLASVAGNSSVGSAIVTGLTSTNGYVVGMTVQVVSGSLTLAGGTTILSINSATQMTLSANFGGSGTSTTLRLGVTGSSANGSVVVTGMLTTVGVIPGMTVTVMTGSLTLGATTVLTVDSTTQITLSANFGGSGTSTSLTFAGASDATANGGGITLHGATDKTIIWDSANANWTSNQDWNIVTGTVFRINNVSVLSATVLGSSVLASSLTSVGILTNLTVAGVITSQQSTGTAPFTIASTTRVANLNVATAGLADSATAVAGGTAGQIPYQTGAGVTSFIAINATAGTVLQSNNTGAPSYSTASYPSVATGTGTFLRANGTNWVASTLTIPNTTTVNRILYSSSASVVGEITTVNNGVLVTDGSGIPTISTTLPTGLTITSSNLSSSLYAVNASGSTTAAGTTQGTATALTAPCDIVIVGTATSNQGIKLPATVVGLRIVVINNTAVTIKVYPFASSAIDALGANVALSIPANAGLELVAATSTQWYSNVTSSNSVNLIGGALNSLPYQSAANTTGFVASGSGLLWINSGTLGWNTTITGMTSISSTTFVGALTGNASTVTTNANLTGPVTSAGNATTVTANAITNAMLAQMATLTIKGNNTGGTANALDLTATQVTAMLNLFSTAATTQGLVPGSNSLGATYFLNGSGVWSVPGGTGGTVTSVSVVTANGVSGSVATATTTPAITLTLGAITPTSVTITATGSLIVGTGTTNNDVFTAGAMWFERALSLTTASVSQVNLDTWPVATYRSANYSIQVYDFVSGHSYLTNVMVTRDDSNNVVIDEYGIIQTGGSLVTISANYDGTTNIQLLITPASTNSTRFKVRATIYNK